MHLLVYQRPSRLSDIPISSLTKATPFTVSLAGAFAKCGVEKNPLIELTLENV